MTRGSRQEIPLAAGAVEPEVVIEFERLTAAGVPLPLQRKSKSDDVAGRLGIVVEGDAGEDVAAERTG